MSQSTNFQSCLEIAAASLVFTGMLWAESVLLRTKPCTQVMFAPKSCGLVFLSSTARAPLSLCICHSVFTSFISK